MVSGRSSITTHTCDVEGRNITDEAFSVTLLASKIKVPGFLTGVREDLLSLSTLLPTHSETWIMQHMEIAVPFYINISILIEILP